MIDAGKVSYGPKRVADTYLHRFMRMVFDDLKSSYMIRSDGKMRENGKLNGFPIFASYGLIPIIGKT